MKGRNHFWLLLAGLAVGWLCGLSYTPVLGTVLSTVLVVVVSLAATLAGVEQPGPPSTDSGKRPRIDPRPVALLLAGIAAAAPLGVAARTHGWFGRESAAPNPNPPPANEGITDKKEGRGAGLYGAPADWCSDNRSKTGAQLLKGLRVLQDDNLSCFGEDPVATGCLEKFVDKYLCHEGAK